MATLIIAAVGAVGALVAALASVRSLRHSKRVDERQDDRERTELRRSLYEKIVYNQLGINKDYWRGVARQAGVVADDIEFALSYGEARRALDTDDEYATDERQRKADALDERLRRVLLE